jgi:hypothetical protein
LDFILVDGGLLREEGRRGGGRAEVRVVRDVGISLIALHVV